MKTLIGLKEAVSFLGAVWIAVEWLFTMSGVQSVTSSAWDHGEDGMEEAFPPYLVSGVYINPQCISNRLR